MDQNTGAEPSPGGPAEKPQRFNLESIKQWIVEDKLLAGLIALLAFFLLSGLITLALSGRGSSTPQPTTVTIPTFESPSPTVSEEFQQDSSPSATPTASPSATPTPLIIFFHP